MSVDNIKGSGTGSVPIAEPKDTSGYLEGYAPLSEIAKIADLEKKPEAEAEKKKKPSSGVESLRQIPTGMPHQMPPAAGMYPPQGGGIPPQQQSYPHGMPPSGQVQNPPNVPNNTGAASGEMPPKEEKNNKIGSYRLERISSDDKGVPEAGKVEFNIDGRLLIVPAAGTVSWDDVEKILERYDVSSEQSQELKSKYQASGKTWQDVLTLLGGQSGKRFVKDMLNVSSSSSAASDDAGSSRPANASPWIPKELSELETFFQSTDPKTNAKATFNTLVGDGSSGKTLRDVVRDNLVESVPLEDPAFPPSEHNPPVTKILAKDLIDGVNDSSITASGVKSEISDHINTLKDSKYLTGKTDGEKQKQLESMLLSYTIEIQQQIATEKFSTPEMRQTILQELGKKLQEVLTPEKAGKIYMMGLAYLGDTGAKLINSSDTETKKAITEGNFNAFTDESKKDTSPSFVGKWDKMFTGGIGYAYVTSGDHLKTGDTLS